MPFFTPSPHTGASKQALELMVHAARQDRLPESKPKVAQLAPPKSLPSQASVPFFTPSPQRGAV